MDNQSNPIVTLKLAARADETMRLSDAVAKAKGCPDQIVGSMARFQLGNGQMLDMTDAEKMLAGK